MRRDAAMIDGVMTDATIDARPIDAGPDAQAFVLTVACGSEVGTITTTASAYSPDTLTINQNEVVKFDMPAGTFHDVEPDATGSDPGLVVGFSTVKCLQFTVTGTFGFHCSVHQFTGSIVVQ